jgi:hypothetical protein
MADERRAQSFTPKPQHSHHRKESVQTPQHPGGRGRKQLEEERPDERRSQSSSYPYACCWQCWRCQFWHLIVGHGKRSHVCECFFGDVCGKYATMCFKQRALFPVQPLLHRLLPCMQLDIVALSKRAFSIDCTCPFKPLPYVLERPYDQVETPDPVNVIIALRSLVTPWTTWGRRAWRFGSRI